jgi:hypothetical protein
MGSELTFRRAQLADKKRTLEEMNLRARSHVAEIRNILDPYTQDHTSLRMNMGRAEWAALSMLWDEMCELKKQIAAMERDLNG